MPRASTTATGGEKTTTRQASKQGAGALRTGTRRAYTGGGPAAGGRPTVTVSAPDARFSFPAARTEHGGRVAASQLPRTRCPARRCAVRAAACQAGAVGVGAVSIQRECRTARFRARDQRHTGFAGSGTDTAGAPVAVV